MSGAINKYASRLFLMKIMPQYHDESNFSNLCWRSSATNPLFHRILINQSFSSQLQGFFKDSKIFKNDLKDETKKTIFHIFQVH